MATVTRLALSLRFSQIGPFLGRNALSLLEAYLRRHRTRTHKWVRERGAMMGPGALRAHGPLAHPSQQWHRLARSGG